MRTKKEIKEQIKINESLINNLNRLIRSEMHNARTSDKLVEQRDIIDHSNYVLEWVLN